MAVNPSKRPGDFSRDLDLFWDAFLENRPGRRSRVQGTKEWRPSVDVSETRDEFIVKADFPGIDRKDIVVWVSHGCLSIRGEKKQEKEESGQGFHVRERSYGSFFRIIPLPDDVDQDKIRASFQNGVLKIVVPRMKDARREEIKIDLEEGST